MTRPVFLANAAMALFAVLLCAWHAYPDRDRLTFLAAGTVYGVLLEQLVILFFEAYRYNADDFLLTVWDVPVVIGLGWTAIIYSGYEIGRRLGVASRVLPVFVALFALHVDLAIDAIAIRIPFWTWVPEGAWFGVQLGNFLGWYLVAALFTAAWIALSRSIRSRPVVAVGTIVAAVAGLTVCLELWSSVATTLPRKVGILGSVLLVSIAVVVRAEYAPRSLDRRIAAVPLLYHGFYLGVLLALGMHREQPLLLAVSLAMIAVGLVVHAGSLPALRARAQSKRARER